MNLTGRSHSYFLVEINGPQEDSQFDFLNLKEVVCPTCHTCMSALLQGTVMDKRAIVASLCTY